MMWRYTTEEFCSDCRRYWSVQTKNRSADSMAPCATSGPYPP